MAIPVRKLGQYGEISIEVPEEEAPPNSWTEARNVDFRDGIAGSAKGYSDLGNTVVVRPQMIMPYTDPDTGTLNWVYAGDDNTPKGRVATYNGTTDTDITNTATYATGYNTTTNWTGAVVNGLMMINNPNHIPQIWDRTTGTLNNDLTDVSTATNYWTSTKTAEVIRGFRNFFIALDITDTATNPDRNPYEIMHSGIVDPYTEPEWAPLTTNSAGSKYISEGAGYLVDCLPLRDYNMVYTENETWFMQYVGGNEVFAVDKAMGEYGLFAPSCVCNVGEGRHFLVSTGDIVIHDGTNAESIVDSRVRNKIFDNLDSDNFKNSFVVPYYTHNEIWFFYPSSGQTYPNRVAKWGIKTNTWSLMNLPDAIACAAYGAVPASTTGALLWSTITSEWNTVDALWNEGNYNPSILSLMLGHYDSTVAGSNLFKGDDTNQYNGSSFTSRLKKEGLTLVQTREGVVSDPSVYKICDRIKPLVTGGPINVRVGGKDELADTYNWEGPYSFNPATDYKLDFRVGGRYLAVEFYTDSNVSWELSGYDMDVRPDGER